MPVPVHHRRRTVGGVDVFYREARPPGVSPDAPVVLLPHGYPCSSYEFRDYMRHLGEHWRLLAPDFPGCGYSATPEDFDYDFDGFSRFLEDFVDAFGVDRFALYLHDFGTWIGLRLALRHPDRIVALIVQNGDIYEDVLGPKYASLKEVWQMERAEGLAQLRPFVSREHFRDEFLNDVRPTVAERIPPDLWELHWTMMTEQRRENAARIIYDLKDNLRWFPRYQAWLRAHRPPTLILWGPQDGYMPAESGSAWLRDLPQAEFHLLDAGHWLLETSLTEAVDLSRDFLARVHPPPREGA